MMITHKVVDYNFRDQELYFGTYDECEKYRKEKSWRNLITVEITKEEFQLYNCLVPEEDPGY